MIDNKMTGLAIYYYFICHRKLWLYGHHIALEDENEDVAIGKYIDENSYPSNRKHIMIHNEINIDYVKSDGTIHEIKKSKKIEEASIWQVKYYLYYLEKYNLSGMKAIIEYPLLKERVTILLTDEDRECLTKITEDIEKILQDRAIPNGNKGKKCLKCAYYDLCVI